LLPFGSAGQATLVSLFCVEHGDPAPALAISTPMFPGPGAASMAVSLIANDGP
jgi:hypothetical protein